MAPQIAGIACAVALAAVFALAGTGCARQAADTGGEAAAPTHEQGTFVVEDPSAAIDPADVGGAVEPEQLPAEEALAMAAGTELSESDVAAYGEDAFFAALPIDDALFDRIYGKSYKADCTVPREELRYLKVLHRDAEGRILVGELMVNAAVADDLLEIFHELYRASYPIEKMHLVDDYNASDDASMEDDNTSAFNYRVIAGTTEMSNHAYGFAIDINPFYNPYCIPSQDYVSPAAAYEYGNREAEFAYKINRGDLCYNLFIEHGFTWGGDWETIKDYQHFEKN